jgi:diguanylate cyclase (GGDEF)-like protein/PAS domain S-box-containing protein
VVAHLPLFGQLAIFLGCVLPLLWLCIALFLQHLHDRTIKESEKETGNLVRVFAEEVNSSINAIDLTLLDLRERWQEEPQNFAAKVQLRQRYLEKEIAFQVGIIDAGGMLVYSNADPHAKGVNLGDREHFRAHGDDSADLLFISKPVFGRVSQRWSIQFTRPVFDRQGRFDGVIVLSVAPDYFTRFSKTIDLGANSVFALLRTSGEMLARSPVPADGLAMNVGEVPFLNAPPSKTGVFQHVSRNDGLYRQYTWRSLPRYGLIVDIGRSMDDVRAPYYRQRTIYLWGGAGISALLALLGYILLAGARHRAIARSQMEQSESRWKYALEGAGEGVWDWNNQTDEVFYSRRWKEMLGYAEHEIENGHQAWESLIHPDDKQRLLAATADYIAGHTQTYANEFRLHCKDHSWKWIFSRGMVISRDANGRALRMIGTHTDITERKQAEAAELEYQSNYDALTGLANRHLLRERVGQAIERAASHGAQVWVAHINLDRFKFVNDTLGHEAGDALLRQVAGRLRLALQPADTAARVAGDEFVLVLADASDEDTMVSMVQRIRDSVAQPLSVEKQEYFLSCTVGVAVYPSDGDNAEALVKHADIAMRRAKEIGRNTLQFYTVALNERASERLYLEGELRHALQRDELLLHYQPQVDVRSGCIVGMEALLRWRHPQLGLIAPDRFIRIAEETGLIVPIGAWVMQSACLQARKWLDAGLGTLRISVNLSGNQFYQQDLIQSMATILADTGLEAKLLDIELTEGLVMTDVEHALDIMHGMKRLGVKLSIDDFGTGYSSLSYLKRFPIDVLKIDQSFVRNITTDPDEAAIACSIIALAHSLRLEVIAEGVETEQQLAYLRRHRCDQIQGYYFSRPLPAADFERLLAEGKRMAPAPLADS